MFNCQVENIPYSIGYSVLDDALAFNLNTARIINKAGKILYILYCYSIFNSIFNCLLKNTVR
jgi:hypothetical protein